jgi:TPR repeat protein/beta-lactamase regulating signal transducer with metallopeptidase domain
MIAQFLQDHPLFWLWTWQSTVWLTIGLLAVRWLFQHRPARGHFVLFLCMVLSLVTPLMTLGTKGLGWGFLSSGQAGRIPESGTPPTPVILSETKNPATSALSQSDVPITDTVQILSQEPVDSFPSFPSAPSPVPQNVSPTRPSVEFNLMFLWLLIVFLLILRLLESFIYGNKIVSSSEESKNPILQEALRSVMSRQGLKRFPRLRISGQLQSLVIWCWGRTPILLVPRELLLRIEHIEWESVFTHELAHWRRRDHWRKLFGQLAVCLVPWQPLLWIAIRQLDRLAELACDDWATEENPAPEQYAQTLVNLVATKEMRLAIPIASNGSLLTRRVERILAGRQDRPWCGKRWCMLAVVAGLLIGCNMALTQPKGHSAENSPQGDMRLPGNPLRDYRYDARLLLSGVRSWADRKTTEGDNADSPYELGWKYLSGFRVERDYELAMDWFRKAANQDDPRAQFVLGCMYKWGLGVVEDLTQSVVWFRKAADQGDPYAQLLMGDHYSMGRGVEQDCKQALAWYHKATEQAIKQDDTWILLNCIRRLSSIQMLSKDWDKTPDIDPSQMEYQTAIEEIQKVVEGIRRSADQENAEAQYHLGYMYDEGVGVEAGDEQAVTWYSKAAEQGHAVAQSRLGDIYAGRRYIPEYIDIESSYDIQSASARKKGNPVLAPIYAFDNGSGHKAEKPVEKLYHNGHVFYERTEQDYKQAVTWYLRAAERGHADAQSGLGILYAMGRGVDQNDKQAAAWFRKAADQGHDKAQFSLGDQYYWGKGVEQDYKQAFYWYHLAAEQGFIPAQFILGVMYMEGKGVKQDAKQAESWLQKAGKWNYAEINYLIGKVYLEGEGSNQDYQQAASWFQKAAKQGNTSACYALGKLYIQGKGVPLDYVEGYKWILESANKGPDNWIIDRGEKSPEVEEILREIREKMTAEEIVQAKGRVKNNRYKEIWIQLVYEHPFIPVYDDIDPAWDSKVLEDWMINRDRVK